MIIFKILGKLYTSPDVKWIKELDDDDIQPFLIQKWLMMNNNILSIVRWLDKYTFYIPPKMYLALAWSVIPKQSKTPFVKYIKSIDSIDNYDEVWLKIRKILEMSDNDFKHSKRLLLKEIEMNKIEWFRRLGMDKKVWKKHTLDFDQMKQGGKKIGKSGLELFGM